MNGINTFIILILSISPYFYVPIVLKKHKQHQNQFIWFILTGLIGLMQSLIYLLILLGLEIPL